MEATKHKPDDRWVNRLNLVVNTVRLLVQLLDHFQK